MWLLVTPTPIATPIPYASPLPPIGPDMTIMACASQINNNTGYIVLNADKCEWGIYGRGRMMKR